MPNWCYNSLTLSNDNKEKIDELVSTLEKDDEKLLECLRPNPSGVWEYDWCIDNWGTKWEAEISDWERLDDNNITVFFDTAWSPPIALYEYLSTNTDWNVSSYYHEEGMGFVGEFKDGINLYYEYDTEDINTLDDIPQNIVEYLNLYALFDDYDCKEIEMAEE